MLFTLVSKTRGIGKPLSSHDNFLYHCTGLLIHCTYNILPSFLQIGIGTDAFAQESSVTSPEELSCNDGSIPGVSSGLCADGFAPRIKLE